MEQDDDMIRTLAIPDDIVSDILTRLPVKTLTRFRSVSTQWNSTITHPSFSKSQFSRASNGPESSSVTLVLTFINRFHSERTIFSVMIPSDQTRPVPKLTHLLTIAGFAHPFVSSLQGLICFNLGAMCVCNPSTRKFVKLPWTQTETMSSPSLMCTRHRANGFGFDPVSNAHKVLDTWITCHDNNMIMEHRVFTVGSGCDKWRTIAGGLPYFPFNESVCVNGQIYFRAYPSMVATERPIMVAFDVNREEFRFIPMREDTILDSEETLLMELDGHLTIVDHHGLTSSESNVLLMWVLINEKDDEWVKKRVEIPIKYSEINDDKRFRFAGTTFSGEMIFAERSIASPFHVFFYDIRKNEARKVEICGLTDFEFSYSNVLMNVTSVNEHVESIKSLS